VQISPYFPLIWDNFILTWQKSMHQSW
jgi:hypothetical protein